ncbi:ras guanine nucleotide exchange factor domain-containing protein [Phycomyces nitens]|nr:ras guanine nucleotide exchange factor domain-containing protein [Phycomyces nitens]
MWLTRKLAAFTQSDNNLRATQKCQSKKKPVPPKPVEPLPDLPTTIKQKTLVIVVAGACNVGKSTLIELGLQEPSKHPNQNGSPGSPVARPPTRADRPRQAWQRHQSTMVIDRVRYLVDIMEIDDSLIDATEDPPEFPESLTTVHGGLICYDITNRDSMDCLPDLLNTYVSRNIPAYLIGLKADLGGLRQVDLQLGCKLASLFGVQLFEVDACSEQGINRMKDIYAALLYQITAPAPPPTPAQPPTLRERRMASESSIRIKIDHNNILPNFHSTTTTQTDASHTFSDGPPIADRVQPTSAGTRAPTGFVYAPTAQSDLARGKNASFRRSNTQTITSVPDQSLTAVQDEDTPEEAPPSPLTSPLPSKLYNIQPKHRKNSLPSTSSNHHISRDLHSQRRGSAPHPGILSSRRGSKDSSYSDSCSTGLTAEDIVDRLIASEPCRGDENIVPVFITFFRKFMKPGELVKMLIERFQADILKQPSPTLLQQRIHSVFSLWLSHYWGDFHSPQTRKALIAFIEDISQHENMRPICDDLAPLVIREPPLDDPDAQWGLMDSDTDTDDFSDAPSTPKQHESKKDSGYVSGSFKLSNFMDSHQAKSTTTIQHCPIDSTSLSSPSPVHSTPSTPKIPQSSAPLKRTSSAGSFSSLFGRSRESSISSSIQFLASLASLKPMTPKQAPPDDLETTPCDKAPISPREIIDTTDDFSMSQRRRSAEPLQKTEEPCRPEFSGGLINLETYNGISASTSWASFGAQTLISSAASITSAFAYQSGASRSEKDQAAYNLKVFLDMTDKSVAEQLTWIEAEVFGKIKAREFVRSIWTSSQSRRPTSVSSDDQFKAKYERWTFDKSTRKKTALPSPQQQIVPSAVVASISHFNFISAWVATSIVTQPKLNKRAAVLEKFMSIAVELRNHNNYNSLMAILAGINNAAVLRLRLTRESISSKKIFKQYQSLEKLMSTDRSFSSYRMALKASESPGIPYLGIHSQDLVSLSEANKDFKADGTIHWEKFRLMGESIMGMMKFQTPTYQKISPDEKILNFIADSIVMTEDEQYKRSILIEPRLKSSSTNKLRDLWSRV